ncbi:MAG: zinc ribbon domain-containing protein [Clostridia bacterium]|nr:zinc ribbon domain-containing protein [Clostridia bacterium]
MKYCLKCGSELSDYATVCGVCGTAVSQNASHEQTAEQPQVFSPSYEYDTFAYDIPTPKKTKKGLLWGLIGGGVGLIVLVAVLCFVFCGSSVKFGMTSNDAHDAMLSNGFIAGNVYLQKYDGEKTIYTEYKGEVGNLGDSVVALNFNLRSGDVLSSGFIHTKADLEVVKEFVADELDAECIEYENPEYDRDDDSNETKYVYLCENGTMSAIIKVFENTKYPEFNNISIQFGDTAYMSGDARKDWKSQIDNIKDN